MTKIPYKFEVSVIWKQLLDFIINNSKFILQLGLLLSFVYVLNSIFSLYVTQHSDFLTSDNIGILKFYTIEFSKLLSLDSFLSLGLIAIIFMLNIMISAMLYRKFLFNEYSGLIGLQFGRQELIIGFVCLIEIIFFSFMGPVLKLIDGQPQPFNAFGLSFVAILFLYISLRFYVALPLFLSEKKIDLLKSWEMSKNKVWNFFGLCIFAALIVVGLSIIIQAILIMLAIIFGFDRNLVGLEVLQDLLVIDSVHLYFVNASKFIYNFSVDIVKNTLDVLIPVYAYNRICELSKNKDIYDADLQSA